MKTVWENAKPSNTQSMTISIPQSANDQIFVQTVPESKADEEALKFIEVKISPTTYKSLYDLSLRSYAFFVSPNSNSITLDLQIAPSLPSTFQLQETNFHFRISDSAIDNFQIPTTTIAPPPYATPSPIPPLTSAPQSSISDEKEVIKTPIKLVLNTTSSPNTLHNYPLQPNSQTENLLLGVDAPNSSRITIKGQESHPNLSKENFRLSNRWLAVCLTVIVLTAFALYLFWRKKVFLRSPVAKR